MYRSARSINANTCAPLRRFNRLVPYLYPIFLGLSKYTDPLNRYLHISVSTKYLNIHSTRGIIWLDKGLTRLDQGRARALTRVFLSL